MACIAAQASAAAAAAEWRGADLGSAKGGSHAWNGTTLTVTGGGEGLDVKPKDDKGRIKQASPAADRCRFVFVERAAGDFEIVARLTGLSGTEDAMAGFIVRGAGSGSSTAPEDGQPAPAVAAVYNAKKNSLGWLSRVPADADNVKPRSLRGGIELAKPLPVWIRLVRMGKNFAVYKSRDELTAGPDDHRLWLMLGNTSGGPFSLDGPLEVGLFVAAGTETGTATATFDSVEIGPPRMRYRTSWVGHTFGSRDDDKHVSNTISAMWVAPDGTCYTSAYWDEGARPVTSYKDGRAARGLPIGTPQTYGGAITGDATHVYAAAVDRIIRCDPSAADFSPLPLYLSVSLLDTAKKHSIVSGLASNGRELFVADSRANLVRVVQPGLVKQRYLAGNTTVNFAAQAVDTAGVAHAAPPAVYLTQRETDYTPYVVDGLKPKAKHTLRCHFAEYTETKPGRRVLSIGGAGTTAVRGFDVVEAAGGPFKAVVVDLPNATADDSGKVRFAFEWAPPGNHHIVICGFELLDESGKRVFAVNCGGPAVDGFEGESAELVDRAFAVERPGPMILDKRGDLWIIQRGNDHPGTPLTAAHPAAVRCFKTDGTFTGRKITDVVKPTALGYDAANDRLLVGENGPDMNVRVYGGLDARPALVNTFGEKGGIYAGKTPGLVTDPSAGGAARFAGIAGLGVDSTGNLYVGGGFQGSDLRKFAGDGKGGWNAARAEWQLNSLMFCNTYDVDPDSDGVDIYGTYNHLKLDLSQKEPGREQQYVGYNWDLRRFGSPDRAGSSQAIVRRLGPDRRLVMVTSGQGTVGDVKIFRYKGEIAIPCGGTRDHGKILWIDADGDGRDDPDELTTMASPVGWITGLCFDTKGDIWAGNATTGGCFMRRFFFKGISDKGVPLYDGRKGEGYEDIRFPDEGDKTSAWGMSCRLDYDADRDILVATYPAAPRKGDADLTAPYFFARYDDWSKGNRSARWKHPVLEPSANPDFFMYEKNLFPHRGYMGMQIAGDYVLRAYLFGEVHVFDLTTGRLVEILSVGPECNGQSAWEDAAMGLRAFRRKNGEYLIFTENSGWGGKNNFFRWKP
ncbi:MAG: hypothetical protein ACKOWG_11130 [Planctomycetia bacterium]